MKRKYRDFPYYSFYHTCIPFPIINRVALVWPLTNLPWHIIITQNSWFILQLTLGVTPSMGLDTCIMTRIHHDGIEQYFTVLKIHCAPPIQPLTTSGNHWPASYLHSLAFSKMSHSWNHTACRLSQIGFHLVIGIQGTFPWLYSSFLFSAK